MSTDAPTYHTPSNRTYRISLRGKALLESARWNKGTAFTAREREEFGLTGRLPSRVNTLDQQIARARGQLDTAGKTIQEDGSDNDGNLQKNAFLQSLKEQNWTLYYALLTRHLKELTPIIYTPTEVS